MSDVTIETSDTIAERGRLIGELGRRVGELEAHNARLREALSEVMSWIKNWDPSFVEDSEWDDTEAKVVAALAPSAVPSGEAQRGGTG